MSARSIARWLHRTRVADGRAVLIRRATAGDEPAIQRFVESLSTHSRYQRYFIPLRELTQAMLARLVQPDEASGTALLAFAAEQPEPLIGFAQYDAVEPHEAEAAVVVGDGWRRVGLATVLLTDLETIAAAAGIHQLHADILRDNAAALQLARQLGCAVDTRSWAPHTVQVFRHTAPWSEVDQRSGVLERSPRA
jgi:GNAT superfamily N-acetyltransferase